MGEVQSLHDLALVAQRRHGGASGRVLARIAERAGHRVSHTNLNAMLAGTYAARPSWATVEALAHLAGVPEAAVFAAAKMPAPGMPFAQELPEAADLLDRRQRDAVIQLITVMTNGKHRHPAA